MAKHVAKAYGPGESVVVDGQEFVDCEFKKARLIYEGGVLPTFKGCHFDSVNWHLEGAADRTLIYLRLLYSLGNKPLVERIISTLRGES